MKINILCLLIAAWPVFYGCKPRQPASSPASSQLSAEDRAAIKAEVLRELKAEQQREAEEKEKNKKPIEDVLPYTIDAQGTAFRFSKFSTGHLYYTLGGEEYKGTGLQTHFFYQMLFRRDPIEDTLGLLMEHAAAKFPGAEFPPKSIKRIVQSDTLHGFEGKSVYRQNNRSHGAYCAILVGTGYYVRFIGYSVDEPEKYIPDFEKLRTKFRFRTVDREEGKK